MLALALGAMVLLVPGCDPGYAYFPLDANGRRIDRWSETIDGVQFQMTRFDDLESPKVNEYLNITNHSKSYVVVVSALVETNDGKSIEGHQPQTPWGGKAEDWIVAPGKSHQAIARWDFSPHEGAAEVLGQRITWVWKVRIGTKEHVLRVRMEKE